MEHYEIIMAGFGGQGIMSAGSLIAYAGMMDGKHVSWYPVYGPEKRGGTAACHIIVSDQTIGSPILISTNCLLVMNRPSLDKFEDWVVEDGLMIVDSSLVDRKSDRKDIRIFEIPATRMASDMGNMVFANVIMLGKLLKETNMISRDVIEQAVKNILPQEKHYLIPEEIKALEKGISY